MPNERITIKDIAEKAGVSVGTVDRVLHKRPNVSKKALSLVNKALEEMKYEPNMYASALANSRRYDFYCLIPKHESEAVQKQISQLRRQLDSGLLTKEEYTAKKQEILKGQ